MKAKKKRGVEPPARVRAIIDEITSTPLEKIEVPLAALRLDNEKGDFNHWIDLLNHFDAFFEVHVKPRADLHFDKSPRATEVHRVDGPFPTEAVLQILRVTRLILENCVNKHLYNSCEHMSLLLASTDVRVVLGALGVLAAFVRKPFHPSRSLRWSGEPGINARLFCLSQGWGGKDEGVGLVACSVEGACSAEVQQRASTLHFELYSEDGSRSAEEAKSRPTLGRQVIHMPAVHENVHTDLELLEELVAAHHVPWKLRFALLTQLRFARAFTSLGSRQDYVRVRLLAFTVLLQSNPDHQDLTTFFTNEPEFAGELVMLVRLETVVPEDIRTLALRALAAQAQDRSRQSTVLTAISAGGHQEILPSLMQRAISSVAAGDSGGCSVPFVEALLALVTALVSGSSGCAALREAGLVPTLLPLLKDLKPSHTHIVSSAVHILEAFMDFSNSASSLFRDIGGLDDTIERLKAELSVFERRIAEADLQSMAEPQAMDSGSLPGRGKSPIGEGSDAPVQGTAPSTDVLVTSSQRLLLKALLRAIALALYTPGSNARLHGPEDHALPACLSTIFRHAKEFGGGVFSLAASVMSDLIHHDPTCYPALDAAGLPRAFLNSLSAGIMPSAEAICSVPNALIALCLNTSGLQDVQSAGALKCFIPVFTNKQYMRALSGETPSVLGAGLEELMRHVPNLRPNGIDMSLDILRTISSIGGAMPEEPEELQSSDRPPMSADQEQGEGVRLQGDMSVEDPRGLADLTDAEGIAVHSAEVGTSSSEIPVPMETDHEERGEQGQRGTESAIDGSAAPLAGPSSATAAVMIPQLDGAELESFLLEAINNVTRLLDSMLANAHSSRLFIERRGVEALLGLYTLPALPVSFGGSATAHSMSVTLRSFSPQHSSQLVKAVCSRMRQQLRSATELATTTLTAGTYFIDLEASTRAKLAKSLAAAECLLALAAVLVRSSPTMLTEMGSHDVEVLGHAGQLQRQIQWQLAMASDRKEEVKKEEGEVAAAGLGIPNVSAEGDEEAGGTTAAVQFAESRDGGSAAGAGEDGGQWAMDVDFLNMTGIDGAGDGLAIRHNRQMVRRRLDEGVAAAVAINHGGGRRIARVSRHVDATQGDLEASTAPLQSELSKGKPQEIVQVDMLGRLVGAARLLFVALSKAMIVPSRRREDIVSLSQPAKAMAVALAKLLQESLEFQDNMAGGQLSDTFVKCHYIGRVVDDITAVLFDNRRRLCNTAMLGALYGHGAVKQLLNLFRATSQLLWNHGGGSSLVQVGHDGTNSCPPWLIHGLRSFARLFEQLVASTLVLGQPASAALLVQPLPGSIMTLPKDPEAVMLMLQVEILEAVMPMWTHPFFHNCPPSLVESVVAIITHVYRGSAEGSATKSGSTPGGFHIARAPIVPPNEASISVIVEMGFPRERAEEALRRVGTNSVEMAMEWLFSHPVGDTDSAGGAAARVAEDDELAQALAMSMGTVDEPQKEKVGSTGRDQQAEQGKSDEVADSAAGGLPKGPGTEDMVAIVINILRESDTLAYPLTDLLVTMAARKDREEKKSIIGCLLERLQDCKVPTASSEAAAIAHLVALLLSEDGTLREVAAQAGLAGVVLDLVEQYVEQGQLASGCNATVLKWISSLLLVIDTMQQFKLNLPESPAPGAQPSEAPQALLGKDAGPSMPANDAGDKVPFANVLGQQTGYLTDAEQWRAMDICCRLLKKNLPGSVTQAVLQACTRLTKSHAVAVKFLESGGLTALLALPTFSLFPGFETVASAVVRHLLEDPLTLQVAMEAEIRHTLTSTLARQNGRIPLRMFLTVMAPVIGREPSVFMQAAMAVCQVEVVGGRPTVVLVAPKGEKEKDKEREKDKEKPKGREREKGMQGNGEGTTSTAASDERTARAKEHGEATSSQQPGKQPRSHRRVPHTFLQVVDQLLGAIKQSPLPNIGGQPELSNLPEELATAMEVDEVCTTAPASLGKGKGKSKVWVGIGVEEDKRAPPKVVFILKLLTEVLLLYSAAAQVVLRRDTESCQAGKQGLINHVLHSLVIAEPKDEGEEKSNQVEKVAEKAQYFILSLCARSGEGRRRVVAEIVRALNEEVQIVQQMRGSGCLVSNRKLLALIDLTHRLLPVHATALGASQGNLFAADMAKTMTEAGMVPALTGILQVLDLDHPHVLKLLNNLLRSLEALTRVQLAEPLHVLGRTSAAPAPAAELPAEADNATGASNLEASPNQRVEGSQPSADDVMQEGGGQAEIWQGGGLHSAGHDHHEEGVESLREAEADLGSVRAREREREELLREEYMLQQQASAEEAEEEMLREAAEDATDLENGEEGEGEEGVQGGENLEDERVIEVRWRDGLTGVNHVQLLGQAAAGGLLDIPGMATGAAFENINDIFSNLVRSERRRQSGYRAFSGSAGAASGTGAVGSGDAGGGASGDRSAFPHPLLARPRISLNRGGNEAGANQWAGLATADRESLLAGGGPSNGLGDIAHFLLYEGGGLAVPNSTGDRGAELAEQMRAAADGDGLLFPNDRAGGELHSLADFSLLEPSSFVVGGNGSRQAHALYRHHHHNRSHRADVPGGRLTCWTDDGQPWRDGQLAARMAQAIEEQFVDRMNPQTAANASAQPTAGPPDAVAVTHGVANEVATEVTAATSSGHLREPVQESPILVERPVGGSPAESDVQMGGGLGAASQDSGGSAATVGESLRSLEVEIGSADGDPAQAVGQEDAVPGSSSSASAIPMEEVSPPAGLQPVPEQCQPVQQATVATSISEGQASRPPADSSAEGGGTSTELAHMAASVAREASAPADEQEMPNAAADGTQVSVRGGGIDPTFLEALPEQLRAEVLASSSTATRNVAAAVAGIAGASEGLPPREEGEEELDPEFLAALPPDIQAEVLAQQRARRLMRAHAAAVEGQPVDMDSASIIATFPTELREEVLLTSSEAVLAALPPALLAEAQLLRERAMSQYQRQGLFRRQAISQHHNRLQSRALETAGVVAASSDSDILTARSRGAYPQLGLGMKGGGRLKEIEGPPLLERSAIEALIRLLRLAQPLGKGLLQRLLLNLCAHSSTRVTLVHLLLEMLQQRSMKDDPGAEKNSQARLFGCQSNVVYVRPQLYEGLPPLVSRRVLDILAYLARHHPKVAQLLLYLSPSLPESPSRKAAVEGRDKGKAKATEGQAAEEEQRDNDDQIPVVLLFKLLRQPMYSQSSSHLEQVMALVEVVVKSAGTEIGASSTLQTKPKPAQNASSTAPPADPPGPVPDAAANAGHEEPRVTSAELQAAFGRETIASAASAAAAPSSLPGASASGPGPEPQEEDKEEMEETEPDPAGTRITKNTEAVAVLATIPESELRLLCNLLAQEGLTEAAYTRVASVVKLLAEVVVSHRRSCMEELSNVGRQLSRPALAELQQFASEVAPVAVSTMSGAALLRVLQAISTLISLPQPNEKTAKEEAEARVVADAGLALARELNLALEPLWQGLSHCIATIESRMASLPAVLPDSSQNAEALAVAGGASQLPPLPPGTHKVLPFVEAFFVLCHQMRAATGSSSSMQAAPSTTKPTAEVDDTAADEARRSSTEPSTSASSSMAGASQLMRTQSSIVESEGEQMGARFAERHRKLMNAFVRQNPSLLEGSLDLLLRVPRLLEFDNKRQHFRSRIKLQQEGQAQGPGHYNGTLRICVRRAYVLEDSYNQLRMRTPEELRGRLTVQFQGEEGIDAGGLTREWYQLLSRVIFDRGALLFTTVGNDATFQPNPNSVYQTEHLSYFKFVGRVVAKALFDGQLLDVHFTRSFYKHILGAKVTYHELEAIDPDYYKNLKWMLENDVTDILDLTFSVDADEEKLIFYEKGKVTDHELMPGGRNIKVTEENKAEYVDLLAEHRMTTAIRPQINAFLEGFQELISRDLISIFNDRELELLISGLPEIDVEDLRNNTDYTGYTSASQVVQWFWETVRSFGKEDCARLLQFITGTSKVPLEGFKALQGISGPQHFQIHKAYGAPKRLPSAHTCFNQLDLPEYTSKEQMEERLLLAIHEANEGFGFG
eukprot:SM000082S22871  [mRNA]  locus=s82:404008:421363:+ [translate_table: standard]